MIDASLIKRRKDISLVRIMECLNPELEITTKEIVYLMNSLRNLLELGKAKDRHVRFSSINFFCNWCLHTNISQRNFEKITTIPEEQFVEDNERVSMQKLKKLLQKHLEETNWRLMSGGVSYRLGMMSGRIRIYEDQDDLAKLIEKKK